MEFLLFLCCCGVIVAFIEIATIRREIRDDRRYYDSRMRRS